MTGTDLLNDPELQAGYRRMEAVRLMEEKHKAQVLSEDKRSPIEIFQELNHPSSYARKQLKKMGVEAVRPTRTMGLDGHPMSPDDVLMLWPGEPLPGFITRQQADQMPSDTVEPMPDGVRVLKRYSIAGRTYSEGAELSFWPERPPRGFITPLTMLEGIGTKDFEPAELKLEEDSK